MTKLHPGVLFSPLRILRHLHQIRIGMVGTASDGYLMDVNSASISTTEATLSAVYWLAKGISSERLLPVFDLYSNQNPQQRVHNLFPRPGMQDKPPSCFVAGKIEVVAPSSAPIFVLVVLVGYRQSIILPKYSSTLPTPPFTVVYRRMRGLHLYADNARHRATCQLNSHHLRHRRV